MLTIKAFFDSCVEASRGEINRGWRLFILLPPPSSLILHPSQQNQKTAEAFSYFWKLISSRTGLPLANPFNYRHITLEMDNLLRNLLRAHTFRTHPWPFGCSASRLLQQTLPAAAICWLLPCLRGLSYSSYIHYRGGFTKLLCTTLHIMLKQRYSTSCLLGICFMF